MWNKPKSIQEKNHIILKKILNSFPKNWSWNWFQNPIESLIFCHFHHLLTTFLPSLQIVGNFCNHVLLLFRNVWAKINLPNLANNTSPINVAPLFLLKTDKLALSLHLQMIGLYPPKFFHSIACMYMAVNYQSWVL
jgi:hypothetical protein